MGDRYAIRHSNDLYFLTFTVIDWMDIFTRLNHRQILVDSLNFCIHNKGLAVHAWVVMSNHLHLIGKAKEGKHMSDLIRDFKRYTSNAIRKSIEEEPESRREWLLDRMAFMARKTKRTDHFKLWQDGSHAMDIFTIDFLQQKVDYIHNNPVRNGLVDLPEHYRFSSARDYFTEEKGLVDIELI
jgi:REP element-mobilizing transposase RayT